MQRVLCRATALVGLLGCHDSSSSSTPAPPPAPELVVFADASDPRLLRVNDPDGVFEYYALRDPAGLPLAITAVLVENADGRTRFDLDAQGLPVEIFAANGTRFSLAWNLAEATALLTVVSPTRESQVSTLVEFQSPAPALQRLAFGTTTTERDGRARLGPRRLAPRGIPVSARARPSTFAWTGDAPTLALGGGTVGAVDTFVSDCGLPSGNLQVFTSVFDLSNGALVGSFPALYLGDGRFSTTIPLGQTVLAPGADTCLAIADSLGILCTLLEALGPGATATICSVLAAALDIATIPSGEAAAMIAGCASAIPLIEVYCSTLGTAPAPGSPDLAQRLCEAVFENASSSSALQIRSCVVALPANVCSAPLVVDAAGAFPVSVFVDLGEGSAIRTLTLEPSHPAEGVDYVATVDIFCLPAGAQVRLSIVGTDGYEDSVTYTIEQSQAEGMFDLWVPGAEQGVRDTVTAELLLPNGSTKTLTAFLVFG
jgi:YD repeat-containing protein